VRPIRTFALPALLLTISVDTARANGGRHDGNGCHYETATGHYHGHRTVRPNRDANAPVKNSRENICPGQSSSNYSTQKCFSAYSTLQACESSGGRAAR
jgi:hypothetical protein